MNVCMQILCVSQNQNENIYANYNQWLGYLDNCGVDEKVFSSVFLDPCVYRVREYTLATSNNKEYFYNAYKHVQNGSFRQSQISKSAS